MSPRHAGDLAESTEIDAVLASDVRIAEADRINDHAFLPRNVGGMLGRHLACGIVAVGQQDDELLRRLARIRTS